MDREQLEREVAGIRWWHVMDLGQGVVTPGLYRPADYLEALRLPESLEGLSVLDVGAWDGFYSFEAERRRAGRVLATDSFSWQGEGWGTKDGFELARRALGSGVDDMDIDVLELSPERVGTFDLVLCLGVLYHMRHPQLALERVASVTGGQLVLESHLDLLSVGRPAMALYPGDELKGDETNWSGPNPGAVEAMLREAGLRQVEMVSGPRLGRRVGRAVGNRLRHGWPLRPALAQDRATFHAWR